MSARASPAGPARACTKRRCRRCRSSAAGPARGCWPTCWSPSMRSYRRSIGNPDLRPRGRRPRPLDARRLGRPGELAVAAAGRAARRACLRRRQDPRRRHAGAGARSRPRPHQDRPAVGLCPRRPAVRATRARRRRCSSIRPTARANGRPRTWPGFSGFLQADAYAGFDKLYGERIVEVACWAHARRKIFDVHESTKSPIAADALAEDRRAVPDRDGDPRPAARPPARRPARGRPSPCSSALKAWFEAQLAKLPPKGGLAQAIRYALGNWTGADPLPRRRPAGDRQQPCRKHPARCRDEAFIVPLFFKYL